LIPALGFKKKNKNDGATGSRKKFDDISSLLDTIILILIIIIRGKGAFF